MTDEAEIIFDTEGHLGRITLNRPQALNALTHDMCSLLDTQLKAWAGDSDIHAVAIKGAGEKAFCAGGDIRAIYEIGREDRIAALKFYADEYRMNSRIHHYAKPYVGLIDGIVMGGGVGVSVHGSHRIAGDRSLFAMPETGIGLFPDVGGSYFLSRLPGRIGMYLGLTGARLKAADLLYTGIATAYVPSDKFPELSAALAALTTAGHGAINQLVAEFAEDPGPAPLAAARDTIDRCFGAGSIEAILAALAAEGTNFAENTRTSLMAKSPTSLKITLRQIGEGFDLTFHGCMKMEYRMVARVLGGSDLFEGIRALLIDRDNQPKWDPVDLAAISDTAINAYFAPLGADELQLF